MLNFVNAQMGNLAATLVATVLVLAILDMLAVLINAVVYYSPACNAYFVMSLREMLRTLRYHFAASVMNLSAKPKMPTVSNNAELVADFELATYNSEVKDLAFHALCLLQPKEEEFIVAEYCKLSEHDYSICSDELLCTQAGYDDEATDEYPTDFWLLTPKDDEAVIYCYISSFAINDDELGAWDNYCIIELESWDNAEYRNYGIWDDDCDDSHEPTLQQLHAEGSADLY
jgi:hypothetical protein